MKPRVVSLPLPPKRGGFCSFPGIQPFLYRLDSACKFVKLPELHVLVENVSGRQPLQSAVRPRNRAYPGKNPGFSIDTGPGRAVHWIWNLEAATEGEWRFVKRITVAPRLSRADGLERRRKCEGNQFLWWSLFWLGPVLACSETLWQASRAWATFPRVTSNRTHMAYRLTAPLWSVMVSVQPLMRHSGGPKPVAWSV